MLAHFQDNFGKANIKYEKWQCWLNASGAASLGQPEGQQQEAFCPSTTCFQPSAAKQQLKDCLQTLSDLAGSAKTAVATFKGQTKQSSQQLSQARSALKDVCKANSRLEGALRAARAGCDKQAKQVRPLCLLHISHCSVYTSRPAWGRVRMA